MTLIPQMLSETLSSVITNVSINTRINLGRTLEEIAHKKSAYQKGLSVITASDDIHVLEVLRQERKEKAPLREVFRELTWENHR